MSYLQLPGLFVSPFPFCVPAFPPKSKASPNNHFPVSQSDLLLRWSRRNHGYQLYCIGSTSVARETESVQLFELLQHKFFWRNIMRGSLELGLTVWLRIIKKKGPALHTHIPVHKKKRERPKITQWKCEICSYITPKPTCSTFHNIPFCFENSVHYTSTCLPIK